MKTDGDISDFSDEDSDSGHSHLCTAHHRGLHYIRCRAAPMPLWCQGKTRDRVCSKTTPPMSITRKHLGYFLISALDSKYMVSVKLRSEKNSRCVKFGSSAHTSLSTVCPIYKRMRDALNAAATQGLSAREAIRQAEESEVTSKPPPAGQPSNASHSPRKGIKNGRS